MLKRLLVFALVLYHATLYAQFFTGTITYAFENEWISDDLKETEIKVVGIIPLEQAKGFINVYQIANEYLIEKSYINDSTIFTVMIQSPEEAYRLYKQGGEKQAYEADPKLKLEEADRKEKANNKKFILGIECQKYIYWFTAQQNHIEVWLANGFTFDKKKQTQRYFGDIFQKEGLVMEYRLVAKNAINVWRIKEISIHAHKIPLANQIKAIDYNWN